MLIGLMVSKTYPQDENVFKITLSCLHFYVRDFFRSPLLTCPDNNGMLLSLFGELALRYFFAFFLSPFFDFPNVSFSDIRSTFHTNICSKIVRFNPF